MSKCKIQKEVKNMRISRDEKLLAVCHYFSNEACIDFGGKLSGQMNCIKNGVSYELESRSPLSLKMQVVKKAVDIDNANQEECEQ